MKLFKETLLKHANVIVIAVFAAMWLANSRVTTKMLTDLRLENEKLKLQISDPTDIQCVQTLQICMEKFLGTNGQDTK